MADETDDLEYSDANVGSAQAQGVRKNISLKLKVKGRGRGRRGGKARRASTKKANEDNEENAEPVEENTSSDKRITDTNLDEVISKLDKTPAFSPMDRTFPEPLHQNQKLSWSHKVNLIGEKVIDPLIHCCEKCSLPILNYGRMIPCKHVFCFDCAKKFDKLCPKCDMTVQRIEQSILGTVFMCTYGGSRHVPGACGRTYLSQRDLQAHVNHRHLKTTSSSQSSTHPPSSSTVTVETSHLSVARDPRDPRSHLHVDISHQPLLVGGHIQHNPDHRDPVDHTRNTNIPMGSPVGQSRQYPHSPANYPSTIPVSSARPNLITVPIQDDGASHVAPPASHIHPQPHTTQYAAGVAPAHALPPLHPPATYPPHAYQHPHPAPAPTYSQAAPTYSQAAPTYSQAPPPITTQTFSQPPPVHHQPPINHPHAPPGGPIYSTPPPVVHHPPPATYTPPRGPQHVPHPVPPPQRFQPAAGGYEETSSYIQQWPPSGVPPPTRAALPPRPITAPPPAPNPNVGHIPPRGPSEPPYRQPYYQ